MAPSKYGKNFKYTNSRQKSLPHGPEIGFAPFSKAQYSRPRCAFSVSKVRTLSDGNEVVEVALSKAEALIEVRNALANSLLVNSEELAAA